MPTRHKTILHNTLLYSLAILIAGILVAPAALAQTAPCNDPITISIGNGTSNNTYLWGYSFYNNNLTEQLYLHSEMGGALQIYGMSIEVANVAQNRQVNIYLAHTNENALNSWVQPSDLTLVWSGTSNYHTGWNDITFTTPFQYNGSDNLLLIMVDHVSSYYSGNSVKAHSCTSNVSRYVYNDGTTYNVTNFPTSGTSSTNRMNVRWHGCTPPCGSILNLSVLSVGSNSAFVQWSLRNASATSQVVLQYDDDPDFTSPQSVTVTGEPPYALTGLESNTTYYLRASITCAEGTTEAVQTIQFTTQQLACAQYGSNQQTIAIGSGSRTDTYLWGYSYYKNALTEQIYLQSELGPGSILSGMAVQTGSFSHPRQISIYLGHTSENSVYSWILPDDLTLVWDGTTQYTSNSWNDITFISPFHYNGTDNLLLVIVDHTGLYQNSPYNTVYTHSINGYSLYIYSDGTSYNVNTTPSSSGYTTSYRTNVRWYHYECVSQVECESPAILVHDITAHDAVVRWAPVNTTNYRIYLSTENATPTLVGNTTGTSYTLTGLDADTRYKVYILPDCVTSFPIWNNYKEFRTDCGELAGVCIEYDDLTSCRVECRHGNFDNPDAVLGVYDMGPSSSSSCHTVHNNPLETDPRTNNQLHTVPDGYATSVRLGNWETGYGAESIRYRYKVDTTVSDLLILKYAAVLQDPNHSAIEQPRFTFRITDEDGVDLDAACYSADFIANSNLGWNSNGSVLWKNWTTVGVSLTQFHGQTIYIKLTTYDCNQGGYAYFVIDCGNKQLISTSCGNTEENTYTAPAGFNYRWYNDNNPNITLSTAQSYHVTSAGTYHCELSFVGASNTSCSSVLTAISGSRYPFSRFNYEIIDTVDCTVNVRFLNSSVITRDLEHNQLTSYPCESYLWIFDDGTTSTAINPLHTLTEGTHVVQLVAMLSNGVCSDTSTITIQTGSLCEPLVGYDERTICDSELPYEWNGVQFQTAGTQEAVLTTDNGVDSTVVMTLTVLHPAHTAVTESACETFTWNGTAYTASGSHTHSHPDANNCIQVDTLHLTINHGTSSIDERTVCDSLRWHGTLYTASTNTPTHHSTNAAGCDSVTTLHLTINNHIYATDEQNVCDSLVWHGSVYRNSTNSPTYQSTNAVGCDSTTTLHLTVRYSNSGIDEQSACDSYAWHGTTYTASTDTPTYHSTNAAGCDSTTTLHLTVRHSTNGIEEQNVCDSLRWHGTLYNASTSTPTYHSTNAAGCDSTTTLHLTVRHSTHGIDEHSVCDSLTWHGNTYRSSTNRPTYQSTNAAGCDSTTTLHLTVRHSNSGIDEQSVCDSLVWHGIVYRNSTNNPTYQSTNSAGCDSTTTLHLTVRYSSSGIDERTVCDALTWHGTTYTQSTDTPTYHSTNAAGCDSTTTLHLTVQSSTQTTETFTVCDSMEWHGTVYRNSTSTATYHSTNAEGCDSTVTLHLTVNHSTHDSLSATACEQHTWHDSTYSAGGTYHYNYTDQDGCASSETLHLNIVHGTHLSFVETACDHFLWHQTDYTESGVYTHNYNNADGCASTDTLHLTVYVHSHSDTSAASCLRFHWHRSGMSYTESGVYVYNYINDVGCPSHDTLHLTIYEDYDLHHYETICEGESLRFADETYSEEGDYTLQLQSSHGCDSTVTLHLHVRQRPQVEIEAEYGCPTETWRLLALTSGSRVTWSADPGNHQLVGHEHDATIRIHVADTTLMTLTADYATGRSCPNTDQVTLAPLVKVTARIECRPEVLRQDHPEIEARDASSGNTDRQWYVDGVAWGNNPIIGCTADNMADELVFTLIAYNDFCADTTEKILYSTNESLFNPNVFTPSLSTNSRFRVQGTGILEFHMYIYTREGLLVFSSDDIETEWDGTHDGEPCPQGNYIYQIRYRGRSMPDGWQTQTGSVLLLR